MKPLNIAVLGATGAVGSEILKVLNEKNFQFNKIKMLASKRSAGKKIDFRGTTYTVEETTNSSFDGVDIALFAGGPASKEFGRLAQKKGCIVIDNSSAFRLEPDVPLVVPEVNPEHLKKHQGLIANPNCSTIIMVMALHPIHQYGKIDRVIVSTYQAASGAGAEGITELRQQAADYLAGKPVENKIFAHQLAFNLIPHIDVWVEDDYTKEEMKMVYETQKIMDEPNMKITATTVRVPIVRSHSESIYVETEKIITPEKAKELWSNMPGVVVQDDPQNNVYPMPLYTSDTDEVYVGRTRRDLYVENGLNFWVVADQIRKGAATNAVQIAETLVKNNLV